MPDPGFFGAANCLSLARIPLSLLASYFLIRGMFPLTGVFALAAVATDWLDGLVARRTGTESDWGRILDPLADKVSYSLFALAMVYAGVLRLWILLVLVSRDALIGAGGLLLAKRFSPPGARVSGKVSTILVAAFLLRQALLPGASLADILPGADILGVCAMAAVLLSLLDYILVFARRMTTEGAG
jgi:CDP-diacylglycerol--glycerol-3-phosphate 3-phosphatidyltransferase